MIPHLEYSCDNNSMWFLWESDPGHSTLCLRHKHANRYTIEPPGSYVNSLEINLNQSRLYCCFTRRAKMVCRLYRILNIVEGIFFIKYSNPCLLKILIHWVTCLVCTTTFPYAFVYILSFSIIL